MLQKEQQQQKKQRHLLGRWMDCLIIFTAATASKHRELNQGNRDHLVLKLKLQLLLLPDPRVS